MPEPIHHPAVPIPPEVERELELLERKCLDENNAKTLAAFSAIARNYLYAVLSPHEYDVREIDGYTVTSLKK